MIPVKVTAQGTPTLTESSKRIANHIVEAWNPSDPVIVWEVSNEIKRSINAIRPWTNELRRKNQNFEQQFYKILMSIAWIESNFKPNTFGANGEIGAYQIKPGTAALISEKYGLKYSKKINDLLDLRTSTLFATFLILDYTLQGNKLEEAIKMYNQGPAYKLVKRESKAQEYLNKIKLKLKSMGYAIAKEPDETAYFNFRLNGSRQVNAR